MKKTLLSLALFPAFACAAGIDSYPAATTPLTGTERLPGNQGTNGCTGCTKKITSQSIANLATKTTVGLSAVTNDVQTKAAIVPNTLPAAGRILVGNAGGTAYAPVPLSGDCTLASTGTITCAGGGLTTASNGLTATGSDVALGGTLTSDTAIDTSGHVLRTIGLGPFLYGDLQVSDPVFSMMQGGGLAVGFDSNGYFGVYSGSGNASTIYLGSNRDTLAVPTASSISDTLGAIFFVGYDGTASGGNAGIGAQVSGAVSSGTIPTDLIFYTGDVSPTEALRIAAVGGEISATGNISTASNIGAGGSIQSSTYILTGTFSVAGLPSCNGLVGQGGRAMVTDATVTVFATIVVGGGANIVPVYCDGTNWRIGG